MCMAPPHVTALSYSTVFMDSSKMFLAGDPNNSHVVIVDDLVQSGGTLIEAAKVRPSLKYFFPPQPRVYCSVSLCGIA